MATGSGRRHKNVLNDWHFVFNLLTCFIPSADSTVICDLVVFSKDLCVQFSRTCLILQDTRNLS